jgi:hypothetical protein
MRKKDIIIKWTYPTKFNNAFEKEICSQYGLYYISRIFAGKETLIYIGKTIDSYSNRMKSHTDNWLSTVKGEKLIRFGIIEKPKIYDNNLVEDIESAIIYEVNPKYNWMKTVSYTYRSGYFVNISNIGYYGELPKSIDSKNHIK